MHMRFIAPNSTPGLCEIFAALIIVGIRPSCVTLQLLPFKARIFRDITLGYRQDLFTQWTVWNLCSAGGFNQYERVGSG